MPGNFRDEVKVIAVIGRGKSVGRASTNRAGIPICTVSMFPAQFFRIFIGQRFAGQLATSATIAFNRMVSAGFAGTKSLKAIGDLQPSQDFLQHFDHFT